MNLLLIYIDNAINFAVKKGRSQAQGYYADVSIPTQAKFFISIGKFSNFSMGNISILLIFILSF